MEVSLASFRKRFTYDPVKDLLGKGGFSEVYKAFDTEDKIFVALKILHTTADNKYNLTNEVKRFKKLRHPNIIEHIEAYEVNTGSNDIHGNPIIYQVGVLEYADKGTLAELLKNGKPDYRQIEDIANDIIEGLAYLHKENIIHRDLKPTNILLFSEGEKLKAKITDFGIAKRADATAASTQLVGTVEYMAPEYFTTGNITTASDMWSLGVMLLEALTGKHPFGKTTQGVSNEQIITNILHKDLSHIAADVPEPLKQIITKCLFREPNIRPQTAGETKGELAADAQSDFGGKTVVLGPKQSIDKPVAQEPKWKRWGKALFDFKFTKGKRSKTIAKELIVFLILSLTTILLPFLLAVILYPISRMEKKKIEPQLLILNNQIDSLKSIIDRPYEFSNSYFGWHKNDSSLLYTDLGVIYNNLCHSIDEDKLSFDWELKSIASHDGRFDSYFSFAEYARSKIKNDDQIWIVNLQTVLRDQGDSWRNFNLVSAIQSVNNLSLDMPKNGGENLSLFPNYKFEPRYFREEIAKRIKQPGWVAWFVPYRVNKNDLFIDYLRTSGIDTLDFISFFERISTENLDVYIQSKKLSNRKEELSRKLSEIEGLWGLVSIDSASFCFIFVFFFFYPFRFIIAIILWAIKTLRNS